MGRQGGMIVRYVLMSHDLCVLAGMIHVLCTSLHCNCTRNGPKLGMLMSHEVVDCMKDVMIHVVWVHLHCNPIEFGCDLAGDVVGLGGDVVMSLKSCVLQGVLH